MYFVQLVILGAFAATTALAQNNAPSQGDWADAYRKANSSLAQLSLDEKIGIVTGKGWNLRGPCVGNTYPAQSIRYPSLCLQDGPLGTRWAEGAATAFTPGIMAGATWDIDLIRQRGQYIGEEARAAGIHAHLGPVAGPLGKIARAGRNWEGFSVDPYLQGIANAHTVEGVQSAGVQAVTKHVIARLANQSINCNRGSVAID